MDVDYDEVDSGFASLLMAEFNDKKEEFRALQAKKSDTPENRHFRLCYSGKTIEYVRERIEKNDKLKREYYKEVMTHFPQSFQPKSAEKTFFYNDCAVRKIIVENMIARDTKNKLEQMCNQLKAELDSN